MDEIASINGNMTPLLQAQIPVLDRGFLFGDQVFEVIVGFHGQLIDADEHLERLYESADKIKLAIPWKPEELIFEIETLAKVSKLKKFALRLAITRGNGLGMRFSAQMTPNKIILLTQGANSNPGEYSDGLKLKITKSSKLDRGASAKTANYLNSIIEIEKAVKEGFDEILWTNSEGEITEAATANIFFLAREGDGVWLVTPTTDSGILAGITRNRLITLARKTGFRVEERVVDISELPRFDEAFVTSTVRGLVPLQKIGKQQLFSTRKNATFWHLQRLYNAYITSKLGFAVDWATGEKLK